MKLKKTIALLTVIATALPSFAQLEGTSVYDRIGHGQDSINALNNLSLYQEAYKLKNWAEAYDSWKQVIEKAPMAQVSLYTQGPTILRNLLTATTDAAQKKQYLDEFMNMYPQGLRLCHLCPRCGRFLYARQCLQHVHRGHQLGQR